MHEANYLGCTLVPRMPIEVETDWLIRKGSLLQEQCLLWSQAPLPVAVRAGARPSAYHSAPPEPQLPSCLSASSVPLLQLLVRLTHFCYLLFPLSQASLFFIATHDIYF